MTARHRIPLVAKLVASVLLLSACSGVTAPPTQGPPEGTIAPEIPSASSTEQEMEVPSRADGYIGPALTTESITLHLLRTDMRANQEDLFNRYIAEFMAAHPNITIEVEITPEGDMKQKIQTLAAAGELPDAIYADGPDIKSYAYYDILLPLDDYLSQEFMDDIVPATRQEHSYNGKLYGMPHNQSAVALYFNRALFQQAGVATPPETDDPHSGWTWEEARDAWQKLTQDPTGSGNPTVWGLASSEFGAGGPGSNYYYEGIFIRSFGDPSAAKDSSAYRTWAAISEDGNSVTGYLDSPEAIQGMTFYQSLFQDFKVTPLVGMPDSFPNQQAASIIVPEQWVAFLNSSFPDMDFGVSPVPHSSTTGTAFTHTGSAAWVVPKDTAYPNEVMAFLVYLHNFENRVEWAVLTNRLPARLSVFDAITIYNDYPNSLFLSELTTIGQPRPGGLGYTVYDRTASEAIKDIALGADPATALHDAAMLIDEFLADLGQ